MPWVSTRGRTLHSISTPIFACVTICWASPRRLATIGTVAEDGRRRALLGRLAGLGWFARHGEVAATQALAMLLEEPPLRGAVLRHSGHITGTDLSAVASFQAELVGAGRARPDLEGRDTNGRPLALVEAKFGARLDEDQVRAYLTNQEARLSGGIRGALILLVPAYRKPEAEALLQAAADELHASTASVSTGVATWDEWFRVLDEAVQEFPADEREAVLGDLTQFRALCRTMVALDIPPLGRAATGSGWSDREQDLRRLVDQVTAQFKGPSGNLLPLGNEPEFGYYRRYIPGGLTDPNCYCAVGLPTGLAGEAISPFWLRYHRDTSSFLTVADRIMASRFAPDARGNGGHVWLPLRVSADRSGAALVDELTQGIAEIRAVAAGPESS